GLGRDAEPRRREEEAARAGQRRVGADARAGQAAEAFLLRIAAATGVVGRRDAARRDVYVDEELPHAAERRGERRVEQASVGADHLVVVDAVAPPRELERAGVAPRGTRARPRGSRPPRGRRGAA